MTKTSGISSPTKTCIICDLSAYHGHQQIEGTHGQSLSSSTSTPRLLTTRGRSRRRDDHVMNLQLCSQLPVILFVRKILRIPTQFLESLLRDCGDPSQWGIDLCRACMGVFKKAEVVHSKISKLIEEFEGLADKLREELRESDQRRRKNGGRDETLPGPKSSRRNKERGNKDELIGNFTNKTSVSLDLRREFLRITCVRDQQQTNEPQDTNKGSTFTGYKDFSRIGKVEFDEENADNLMDHDDSSFLHFFEKGTEAAAKGQTESLSIPELPPVEVDLNGKTSHNISNSEDVEEDHKEAKKHLEHSDKEDKNDVNGSDDIPPVSPSRPPDSSEGFYCEICPKKKHSKTKLFETKDMLELHKANVHQGMTKPFECKRCGKLFAASFLLRRHMSRHSKMDSEIIKRRKARFCVECNRQFRTMQRFNNHLRTKRHLPPVSEEDKLKLRDQEKDKSEARKLYRFECIDCDRKFKTKANLNSHMATTKYHNSGWRYQCEFCTKGFMQRPSLESHHALEHHVELNIQPITCVVCGKKFSSKRNMENHVRVQHTKNTPFRCTECDMGFMSKLMHNRHFINVHAKDRQFQCTDCPKRFSDSTQLNIHMRVHSGEKPLKCKDCGKEFADPPTFKRHQETHGNTTYVCSFCGKQFKVWHSYRIHMKRHNQHLSKLSNQKGPKFIPVPECGDPNVDSTRVLASEDIKHFTVIEKNETSSIVETFAK